MKIAIHHNKGSFSERWIKYCQDNNIEYKLVNAYNNDIVQQLEDYDCFMWHHYHENYKDVLFAKQLLFSLEIAGKKVFPDFNTCWHFDDKVGQKYLLEAISAPLVPSYVFYTKKEALQWLNETTFPKVFKLRGGAGSVNVKLAKTKSDAKSFVKKAFGRGFAAFDRVEYMKERIRIFKKNKQLIKLAKGFYSFFLGSEFAKMHGREKGYVYFQEFIPNNTFDIRIVVVGDRAFGLKRLVRENDFRASGGGRFIYTMEEIDERCVRIAFNVNKTIKSQSIAYDFIFDENNNPLIVEISYGYVAPGYDKCEGYWTSDLEFHKETFNPYGWMIDNLLDINIY